MFLLQINTALLYVDVLIPILVTLLAVSHLTAMYRSMQSDRISYARRAELDTKWWQWYAEAEAGSSTRGAEKFLEWAGYGALHFRNDDYFLPPESVVQKLLYLSKFIPPELRKHHTDVVRILKGKEPRYSKLE